MFPFFFVSVWCYILLDISLYMYVCISLVLFTFFLMIVEYLILVYVIVCLSSILLFGLIELFLSV
jgi:hypothetical protein